MICVHNKYAQALAKNPVYNDQSKHIDIMYHFSLRMYCQERDIAQVCEITWSSCRYLYKASKFLKFS